MNEKKLGNKIENIPIVVINNTSNTVDNTNNKVNTLLINPPFYNIKYPNLGLSSIEAFLKQRGFSVEQIDENKNVNVKILDMCFKIKQKT